MPLLKTLAAALLLTLSAASFAAEQDPLEAYNQAIKDTMIAAGENCGLAVDASAEKWQACQKISQELSFGSVREIDYMLYTLREKSDNYSFAVVTDDGQVVKRPYYSSLPLICRNLGRAEGHVRLLIATWYPKLIEGDPMRNQSFVDLINAQIDVSNAIFVACGLEDESAFAKIGETMVPLRAKLMDVLKNGANKTLVAADYASPRAKIHE
jgi:hypothetical protein